MSPAPHTKQKVGENLQDHLLLSNLSLSKPQITEADYTDGSIHGTVYFSSALPPPPSSPLVAPGSLAPPDDANEETASLLADTTPPTATTAAAAPSSSSSVSAPPAPAEAVLGYMYADHDTLSKNLCNLACFAMTRPGFWGSALRAAVCTVCWIVGWVTPVCRMTRGRTLGVSMLVTTIKSKGTVRLASGTDVSAPPLIDPGYLSHPEDQRALRECWRTLRRAKRETAAGKALFGSDILPGKK